MRRLGREGVFFALVGASGIVVNNATMVVLNRYLPFDPYAALAAVGGLSIVVYHVYSMICFVVANLSNYTLNRLVTFRYPTRSKVSGGVMYLLAGLAAQAVSLSIATYLLSPWSPLHSPALGLDGSTGFRTPLYWAHLIATILSVPVSFVLAKKLAFPDRGHLA